MGGGDHRWWPESSPEGMARVFDDEEGESCGKEEEEIGRRGGGEKDGGEITHLLWGLLGLASLSHLSRRIESVVRVRFASSSLHDATSFF